LTDISVRKVSIILAIVILVAFGAKYKFGSDAQQHANSARQSDSNIEQTQAAAERRVAAKIKPEILREHAIWERVEACAALQQQRHEAERKWSQKKHSELKEDVSRDGIELVIQALLALNEKYLARSVLRDYREVENVESYLVKYFKGALSDQGYTFDTVPANFRLQGSVDSIKQYLALPSGEKLVSGEFMSYALSPKMFRKLLKGKKFSNAEIVELMAAMRDINVADINGQTLLEVIVELGDLELLVEFEQLGGEVTNKPYGLNALEHLIFSSQFDSLNINMLEYLSAKGLDVHIAHASPSPNSIAIGTFFQKSVADFDRYRTLLAVHNIFPTLAPSAEQLLDDVRIKEIADNTREDKWAFIHAQLTAFETSEIYFCDLVREESHAALNSISAYKSIEQAETLHGDDYSAVIDTLESSNPFAADCYRQQKRPFEKSGFSVSRESNELLDFLLNNQLELAMEKIALSPSGQKSAEFWKASRYLPVDELLSYGLAPQTTDFSRAVALRPEHFQRLLDTQWDFDWASPHGHNLLTYASARCKVELVNILAYVNYRYQHGNNPADPLAYALVHCPLEKIEEMISALMVFEPEIKNIHQGLLAKIRLHHLSMYTKLTMDYPVLAVEENVVPTSYSVCGPR